VSVSRTKEEEAAMIDALSQLEAGLENRAEDLAASVAEGLERSTLAHRIDQLAGTESDPDLEPEKLEESAPGEPAKRCSQEGCEEPARARGLCSKHYQRQRYAEKRAAEEKAGGATKPKRGGGTCSIEGCSGTVYARGMCGKHFMEWVRAKKKT
jgi:hypothetical protein